MRILLWALAATMISTAPVVAMVAARGAPSAPAAALDGAALFVQRCASCHSVKPGKNGAGPSLAGVAGRKAAGIAGFAYSPALRNSKLVWTPEQLSAYLAAPQKLVPGTKMPIGVADAVQRAALVRYLAGVR